MNDDRITVDVTLRVEVHGRMIGRSYEIEGVREVVTGPTSAWSSIKPDFEYGGQRGLSALSVLLDSNLSDDDELEGFLRHFTPGPAETLGEMLFSLLFGGDAGWATLCDRLDNQGPIPPALRPLRVRVHTREPELIGMPWRLTSDDKRLLIHDHWTFEGAADPRVRGKKVVEMPEVPSFLLIAPEYPKRPNPGGRVHAQQLREALVAIHADYEKPSKLRLVQTIDDLRSAFEVDPPQFVYYFGHAKLLKDADVAVGEATRGVELDFGAAGPGLSLSEFGGILKRRPPLCAYINACSTAAAGHFSALNQLSPSIPLVVANRTSAFSEHAAAFALSWFRQVLFGADPVEAIGSLREDFADFQWATHVVQTAYETWHPHPNAGNRFHPERTLRLDREKQRERVDGRVAQMCRHPHQRMEILGAYGEPGNMVTAFSGQAIRHVTESRRGQYKIHHHEFPFPDGGDVKGKLKRGLAQRLKLQDLEQFPGWIEEKMRSASAGVSQVFWFHWQNVDRSPGTTSAFDDVKEWIKFLVDDVCPKQLLKWPLRARLVCLLSSELTGASLRSFHKDWDQFVNQRCFSSDYYDIKLLDELDKVSGSELRAYFRDPRSDSTVGNNIDGVADQIIRITGGRYADIIETIKKGERVGWVSWLLGEPSPKTRGGGSK